MSAKYEREKHLGIKRRLLSLYENHSEQIEKGEFLRMSTVVIEEMQWLSDQLDSARKLLAGRSLAMEEEEEPVGPKDAA